MYTPALIVAGSYVLPITGLGPLHVPPASAPVSCVNRSIELPLLHTVIEPSAPAFGEPVSFTVTVALALLQGATPVTVYTYAPGVIVAGS